MFCQGGPPPSSRGRTHTIPSQESFFSSWDNALHGFVPAADRLLADLRSPAQLILNELACLRPPITSLR